MAMMNKVFLFLIMFDVLMFVGPEIMGVGDIADDVGHPFTKFANITGGVFGDETVVTNTSQSSYININSGSEIVDAAVSYGFIAWGAVSLALELIIGIVALPFTFSAIWGVPAFVSLFFGLLFDVTLIISLVSFIRGVNI